MAISFGISIIVIVIALMFAFSQYPAIVTEKLSKRRKRESNQIMKTRRTERVFTISQRFGTENDLKIKTQRMERIQVEIDRAKE